MFSVVVKHILSKNLVFSSEIYQLPKHRNKIGKNSSIKYTEYIGLTKISVKYFFFNNFLIPLTGIERLHIKFEK